MKVAFIGNQLTSGGGATSLFLMLKALKNFDLDIYVWLTEIRSNEMKAELELFCKEVKLIELDDLTVCQTKKASSKQLRFVLKRMRGIEELIQDIKTKEIDIVHFNNSVFSHTYERIKMETDVLLVSHVREWITFDGKGAVQDFVINKIEKYSDAIIGISPTEAGMFRHKNALIMANPFDHDSYEKRSSPELQDSVMRIGMAARPSLSKGHLQFVLAAKRVLELSTNCHKIFFHIYGLSRPRRTIRKVIKRILKQEPYYEVKRLIKQFGLEEKVLVHGYKQNFLHELMKLDIIVRPSLHGDPWGRDIIEAMAMGKPVVAYGSSEFYIKNGETGYLVPINDVESLAVKLTFLADNAQEAQEIGERARRHIGSLTDLKRYGLEMYELYLNLLPS